MLSAVPWGCRQGKRHLVRQHDGDRLCRPLAGAYGDGLLSAVAQWGQALQATGWRVLVPGCCLV